MRISATTTLHLLAPIAFFLASTTLTLAQVPDHAAGSICATPQFWCWAVAYGAVGTPCTCPSPQGLVAGTYI